MTRLRFALIFWAIILIFVAVYSGLAGADRKSKYVEVQGHVVDLIPVHKHARSTGGYDVLMPQVSYPVGDSQFLFVDHIVFRKVGTRPTILYKRDNPKEALIYSLRFWIDFGLIVPTFLISGFVFSIVLVAMTPDKRKGVILPGHLDANSGSESAGDVHSNEY